MGTREFNRDSIKFISDTHFGHKGVLKYGNRAWNSVGEMDKGLIYYWNKNIKKDDYVFHTGDFGFGSPKYLHSILDQLHGKIILIMGNHDYQNIKQKALKERFHEVHDYLEIKVKDGDYWQYISMCHYQANSWRNQRKGAFFLHGHSHGNSVNGVSCPKCTHVIFRDTRRMDIGVDCHNFIPLSYYDVKDRLTKIPHGREYTLATEKLSLKTKLRAIMQIIRS